MIETKKITKTPLRPTKINQEIIQTHFNFSLNHATNSQNYNIPQ